MKPTLLSILFIILIAVMPAYGGEIHDLAGGGHLAGVKTLLAQDPGLINAVDEQGSTPLHSACFGGHLVVVKLLIEKGANIQAVDGGGFTPLQLASYGGNRDVVQFLLEKGADINAVNEKMNMTALDYAFMKELRADKLNVVPLLIDRGAEFDVNKKNQFGYTLLDMAIVFDNPEAVKYLIGLGADISTQRGDGNTPLINAIKRGRPEIAKLLIESKAEVNAPDNQGNPPIRWAIEKGFSEIVAMLLANGTQVDFIEPNDGRTLLHIAALKGYKDLVDILLSKGSDANAEDSYGKTPLFYASRYGHRMVADLLISNGAEETDDLEENFGRSPYLTNKFKDGEAVAWYLANRGWAVKTKNHMLVFDAEEFGVKRPTEPCLANGFLTTDELGDQNVFAIYTSYHGEPGEPAYIHTIEDSVASITYVHNEADPWRGSEGTVYMKPDEERKLDDMQIVSISILESMPGLGYLCKLDGLTIFYSGFQPEDIEKYKTEIDFLTKYTGEVDLAFLPIAEPGTEDSASIYLCERFHPQFILPLDPDHREDLYPDMATMLAGKGFKGEVLCAENPGDHFVFLASEEE
jgi:ankyrin repeat protein